MKRKTIVIFGISSFVGSSLAHYLKEDYKIIGTYFENKVNIPGVLTLPCDVMKKEAIQMILFTFRPELTIYAVGCSSVEACHEFENYADALNSGGLYNVVPFCERYQSKVCYISSAFIFSGENQDNQENDTPLPNTVYGKSKASAEFFIQKSCLNYMIFRCCNFYGRGINPRFPSWFEVIEKKSFNQETFGMDSKIHIGFLDSYYLAEAIKISFENDVTNRLFQLSSKDALTYYDFVQAYSKVFKTDKSLVKKINWEFPQLESSVIEQRLDDNFYYKLDVTNLESALGFDLPSVEESLNFSFQMLGGGKKLSGGKKKSTEINYI